MVTVEEAQRVVFWCCTRKQRYRNREEALQDSTIKKGTRAYRCPFCKGHHVGNTPKMKDLRRIAEAIRVLAQEKAA